MGSTDARYRDALARCHDSPMCRFSAAAVHDVSLLVVLPTYAVYGGKYMYLALWIAVSYYAVVAIGFAYNPPLELSF